MVDSDITSLDVPTLSVLLLKNSKVSLKSINWGQIIIIM